MPDGTFTAPDLTTFCGLDGLGLEVTGQRLEPDRAVLACRIVDDDRWCRRCGCQMYAIPLVQNLIPIEIEDHLVRHNLPYLVVNRYICPRGHCQMWFVPQLGNAESKMVVRDM